MMICLALLEGTLVFASLWIAMPHGAGGVRAAAVALAGALGTVTALYYTDAYDLRAVRSPSRLAQRLPRALAFTAFVLAAAYVLRREMDLAAVLAGLAVVALLPALRMPVYALLRRGTFAERVLIIGSGLLARRAVEAIENDGWGRAVVVGVVDEAVPDEEAPRTEPLAELALIIESTRPDRIVAALEERRRRLPVRPLLDARLAGIAIEDGATFCERMTGQIAIEALTPSSLIFSRDYKLPLTASVFGRALSLVTAVAALVLAAPLIGLLAVLIRLDSRGPVFFVQERMGLGGRHFRLVKFRTMREIEGPHSEWAGDNSDRITRVGAWLRRFRLDELPQFWNVLRGDMDVVGPRPHPVTNFSLFVTVLRNTPECGEQIPYYSIRSMVRPGITGWAQVRYRYANNLEEEIEKMRYDLYYVKHRSLWLDLRILADTAKTVLSGHEGIEPAAAPSPARTRARVPVVARS